MLYTPYISRKCILRIILLYFRTKYIAGEIVPAFHFHEIHCTAASKVDSALLRAPQPTFQERGNTVIVERSLLAGLGKGEVEGESIPPVVSAVPYAKLLGLGNAAQAFSQPLRFLEAQEGPHAHGHAYSPRGLTHLRRSRRPSPCVSGSGVRGG